MGESEKLGLNSFLFLVTLLLWPLLFSGSTLFFSERQKDSLIALGKVKASLWRLGLLKNTSSSPSHPGNPGVYHGANLTLTPYHDNSGSQIFGTSH